ncbi:hypothetical protein GCM10009634_84100 [Saccharothrix xinjiangensis]
MAVEATTPATDRAATEVTANAPVSFRERTNVRRLMHRLLASNPLPGSAPVTAPKPIAHVTEKYLGALPEEP